MNIPFSLRPSLRARNIRITIKNDGAVTVTVPARMPPKRAEALATRFVHARAAWIAKHLDRIARVRSAHPAHTLPGENVGDYARYKSDALALVAQKVDALSALLDARAGKAARQPLVLRVGNQKTRWGSCSRKGVLSFNFRILFLSEPAQEYLVVHELCHLREFNHTPRFWALVALIVPEYKERRRELRGFNRRSGACPDRIYPFLL